MIQAQVSQAELLYEAQQRKVRQFRTNVIISWVALLGFLIFLFNGPIEIDSEFIDFRISSIIFLLLLMISLKRDISFFMSGKWRKQ